MEKTISIYGIKTHFNVFGTGNKNIIMLHGWGGSAKSFEKLASSLAKETNTTVFVPDLPGFGTSEEPNENGWYINDYEKWLEEFIKINKIESPILYGHSFGCRVIFNFLFNNSKWSEKIILTGAAGINFPPSTRERLTKSLSKKLGFFKKLIPEKIYKLILRKVFKAHDWASVSESMKKTFQNTINEPDIRKQLSSIKSQTLLLWGQEDGYTPIKAGHIMNSEIKDATLHVFETGRHGIHYTHEKEIIEYCKEFLN